MKTKILASLVLILLLGLVGPAVDMGGKGSQVAPAQMVAGSSGADPITVYPLGFSSEPATGTITCVAGSRIANGRTISFTNANGQSFTYQFYNGTGAAPPNAIPYNTTMSAADVAQAVAAALTPRLVNGSYVGPRVTFSVSGDTLYLTQGRSGTGGNNLISGTAQLDGFVFTGFAGGATDDRVNIQAAFNSVAPGGTVLLKATDVNGNPTAFDLGKFEYFLYVPPLGLNSRAQPNISNHRLFIDKSMTVQGETVGGYTTTIKNGFQTFAIGLNAIPTGPGPITIDGIQFQDAGFAPIYAEQSAVPITITHNTITNHLSDLFAGKAKSGWDSSKANNWGNPEDGTHITMVQFDASGHTYTDVTASYTKAERLAAFLTAEASMAFDPSRIYITDGTGQNAPYYGQWIANGMDLENAYGPLGLLGVPLTISGNDINQNATLPTSQFTPVWYSDTGILTEGHTIAESTISGNTLHNVSRIGIVVADDTGTVTIQGNRVEVGPAGSYTFQAFPHALMPPRLGANAIVAVYNVADVYQYPPNGPITYPPLGGTVSIVNNTVTNSSSFAKDAGGISVVGENGSFFSSVAITGNQIELTNGRHGIQLSATEVPGASGPTVSQNTVTGSGFAGILLGLAPGVPKDTVNVSVTDLDLRGYTATSADTSFPELPAAYVYLGTDTHNNTGTKICVPANTTYSEFIRDLGTNNDFEPSCSALAMTGYLIEKVNQFNLPQGMEDSLSAKLNNVLGSLTAANADQRSDATNKLNAFINECQAQSGKQLTVDQARVLIAVANDIITTLTANP